MSELVIEVGYQVPPNAVFIRTIGDEIRVTFHPEPEADVLAALRDDIVDAIINLSNTETDSSDNAETPTSNAKAGQPDRCDRYEGGGAEAATAPVND